MSGDALIVLINDILGYLLDGTVKNAINGIEVLDKIKAFDKDIPVISKIFQIKKIEKQLKWYMDRM